MIGQSATATGVRSLRKVSAVLVAFAVHAIVALGATGKASSNTAFPYDMKKARAFWAFRPIANPAPPAVKDSNRIKNPIDQFVLARVEAAGLLPAGPASRAELIRRVSFDLTGLPPTPEDIKGFVDDDSTDAYPRLIEKLLGSVHFGERWAQHWLDTVRYAETEGFEYDRHLPDAWRFRDYVIDSINADKPFDQFITEQIAGDEIDPKDPALQTAVIFHRLGPVRRNAGNPDIALSRNEVLTERTDVIGATFLGLTVGCARCHDHRLDPISQKDYYRLQAYLAATHENDILLGPTGAKKAFEEKTRTIKAQLKKLRDQLGKTDDEQTQTRLKKKIAAIEKTQPPSPPTIPSIHNDFKTRTAIHVLKRGEWNLKGEPAGPRPLSILVDEAVPELPADCPNPRTQLARWLTDKKNPVTARVIVNRLWQHHFGTGLVKTPNDFGSHGDRPSHPELLDWLATQLIKNGWRMKPLHRLILLSNTYQQAARPSSSEAATELDPDNRLLSRFNRRRLSAEEIRDAMLHVSGRLSVRAGGKSVIVPVDAELIGLLYKPEQWQVTSDPTEHDRRSIYLIAKRNLRLPFMEAFDQPALTTSCGRRETSTHAPQALEMLNGTLANALAESFAKRLQNESSNEPDRIIERGFQLATGRVPTANEREYARGFLRDQPLREFALALFNLNAFLYVE